MTKTKNIDWHRIEWADKRTGEIAAELGINQAVVSLKRREYAPHTLQKHVAGETESHFQKKPMGVQARKFKVDPKSLDWNKSTDQLSEELSLSKSTISKYRKAYAPETMGIRFGTNSRYSNVDWSRPDRDLYRELGVSKQAISFARRRHAPETVGKVRAEHNIKRESPPVLDAVKQEIVRMKPLELAGDSKTISHIKFYLIGGAAAVAGVVIAYVLA